MRAAAVRVRSHADSAIQSTIIELSIDSTGGPVIASDQTGSYLPSIEKAGEGGREGGGEGGIPIGIRRSSHGVNFDTELCPARSPRYRKKDYVAGLKLIMAGIIIPKRSHIDLMMCNFHQYVRPSHAAAARCTERQPSPVPQIVS